VNELEALEEYVPLHAETPAWEDVLRRARRGRSPRLLVAVAVVLAVFGGAPALAVVLLHDAKPGLPSGADRSNVAILLQPKTGRVLLEVAPWKGHDGFCYFAYFARSGCVPRSKQTVVTAPPLFGWTFNPRVVTATATTFGGKHVRLTVRHFGGRINATFFFSSTRYAPLLRNIALRDREGIVIVRLRK
jgi:hypothetical protein